MDSVDGLKAEQPMKIYDMKIGKTMVTAAQVMMRITDAPSCPVDGCLRQRPPL